MVCGPTSSVIVRRLLSVFVFSLDNNTMYEGTYMKTIGLPQLKIIFPELP